MAEQPQGLVKVKIVSVPGYVPGVLVRFPERDVIALEKAGKVVRAKEDELSGVLKKADKKADAGAAKK